MSLTTTDIFIRIKDAILADPTITVDKLKLSSNDPRYFDPRKLNDPNNPGEKLSFTDDELIEVRKWWGANYYKGMRGKIIKILQDKQDDEDYAIIEAALIATGITPSRIKLLIRNRIDEGAL